jgi:hypothetical protein
LSHPIPAANCGIKSYQLLAARLSAPNSKPQFSGQATLRVPDPRLQYSENKNRFRFRKFLCRCRRETIFIAIAPTNPQAPK